MKKTGSAMMKKNTPMQNTSTGSGSRPMGGKFPIPTSAPKDMKALGGRKTKSALK